MDIINNINDFLNEIGNINKLHFKYVEQQITRLNDNEKKQLNNLIEYFINKGFSLPVIAKMYNELVNDSIINQRYFVKHNNYMYNSFKEVNQAIYNNHEKMVEYLVGLSISHYLWNNHVLLHRFFTEEFHKFILKNTFNNKYLEVGPGYGELFLYAMNNSSFAIYEGIDVSYDAVKNSLEYIKYNTKTNQNYKIIQKDFYDYENNELVDAFVCSEVLEHIENPLLFLQKISDIVHKNSFIYLTTAINAPSSGHIYLFRSKEEVLNLVVQAGLNVKNYICVDNSGNNIKIKDYKKPILIGMVLEKNI